MPGRLGKYMDLKMMVAKGGTNISHSTAKRFCADFFLVILVSSMDFLAPVFSFGCGLKKVFIVFLLLEIPCCKPFHSGQFLVRSSGILMCRFVLIIRHQAASQTIPQRPR